MCVTVVTRHCTYGMVSYVCFWNTLSVTISVDVFDFCKMHSPWLSKLTTVCSDDKSPQSNPIKVLDASLLMVGLIGETSGTGVEFTWAIKKMTLKVKKKWITKISRPHTCNGADDSLASRRIDVEFSLNGGFTLFNFIRFSILNFYFKTLLSIFHHHKLQVVLSITFLKINYIHLSLYLTLTVQLNETKEINSFNLKFDQQNLICSQMFPLPLTNRQRRTCKIN